MTLAVEIIAAVVTLLTVALVLG
ncbi:MAG: hypothetical protein QOD52_2306, partial [Gaiellaceae bacterium]|nr:hypothetical protein [Gaiellaceae bacterium]